MRRAGAALLVAAAAVFAFATALPGSFVWDDLVLIAGNPLVHGLDGPRLFAMFSRPHLTTYMPLGWLAFAVIGTASRFAPWAFRAAALGAHALSAACFYALCRELFRGRKGGELAALAAAVGFAVHPVHAWTAAWAIELPDALASALVFLAALAHLRGRSAFTTAAFAASLLFRWKGVALPAMLLALDFWPLGRRDWRRAALEKLPLFLLAAAAAAATVLAKSQEGYAPALAPLAAARALCVYLWHVVWPFGAKAVYALHGPDDTLGVPAAAAGALALLTTALLWLRRRAWPAAWTAWLCFAAAAVPTALASQDGAVYVFPPYGYLAAAPAFALLAEGWRRARAYPPATAGLALVLLSWTLAARREARHWRSPAAFWRFALLRDPRLTSAYAELGGALLDAGRPADAWFYLTTELQLRPGDPFARRHLERLRAAAPDLKPDLPAFWTRESRDWLDLGRPEEALRLSAKALQRRPRSAQAHDALADALESFGRKNEAASHRAAAAKWRARARG